VVDKFR